MRSVVVLAVAALSAAWAGTAQAMSGPSCLIPLSLSFSANVNLRAGPSASTPVLQVLAPEHQRYIRADGPCLPRGAPAWGRWCRVKHLEGDSMMRGWVSATFMRDRDCS